MAAAKNLLGHSAAFAPFTFPLCLKEGRNAEYAKVNAKRL